MEEKDGIYPFAEIESAAATEHEILTVCTARPAGEAHGKLQLSHSGGEWHIHGTHGECDVEMRIVANGEKPVSLKV